MASISAEQVAAEARAAVEEANKRFIAVYDIVLKQLNSAKACQEYYKRGKAMTIEDLSPAVKNKSVFWNKLPDLTSDMVKTVYDLSITSSHGLIDVLAYMNTAQRACEWVDKQGKYWICDIDKQYPIERSDYDRLLAFVHKLVRSNKMHASVIARHKRAKTKTWARSHVQGQIAKSMDTDFDFGHYALAHLAAVFIWMCETKNMNLSFVVQNSAAGSMVLNRSTLLARKRLDPQEQREAERFMQALEESDEESEAQVHPEPLSPVLEQKEEEIPESWEDLDI